MKALIDGDILIYRTGFASEDVDEGIAIARLEETIDLIFSKTGASDYKFWISDSLENNWRFKIYPSYKISRKDKPKPKHYEALTNYLLDKWEAEVAWGEEADDALGIDQDKEGGKTILCSIDKDLLQIPGFHFNWVKGIIREITPLEGHFNFYKQLLIGDASDDIPGVPKIGEKTAPRLLEGCESEEEMFVETRNAYWKAFHHLPTSEINDIMLLNGQLLKIRTKDGELWQFPQVSKQLSEKVPFITLDQAASRSSSSNSKKTKDASSEPTSTE